MKWVLSWTTAIGVLAVAFVALTEFAYCLKAELNLSGAARAAALEATLPRASYETVCAAAKRRLATSVGLASNVNISLRQNGAPVGPRFQPQPGDRIAVTLSVPTSAVQPYWLQALIVSSIDEPITARAEGCIPGKEFPASMARRLTSAR